MKRISLTLAAVLSFSATAAVAGGLAPPLVQMAATSMTAPLVPGCPRVDPAVRYLQRQGYSSIVVTPAHDRARIAATSRSGADEAFVVVCRDDALTSPTLHRNPTPDRLAPPWGDIHKEEPRDAGSSSERPSKPGRGDSGGNGSGGNGGNGNGSGGNGGSGGSGSDGNGGSGGNSSGGNGGSGGNGSGGNGGAPQGDNGWGNGNQDAPGSSGPHNGAENDENSDKGNNGMSDKD